MTGAARLRLGRGVTEAFVGLAVLASAACGSAQPSTSPISSASPGEACALTTEPGPADEPDRDGGDLIDMTDYGGGRWRLCLTEPAAVSAEATAWCIWTPDRTAVSEIDGLRARIGALAFDTYLSIDRYQFELHTTDQGTTAGNYAPGPVVPIGDAAEDGRSGNLAFHVELVVDPENGAPPGAQPRYAGIMTWKCGDPPPPR